MAFSTTSSGSETLPQSQTSAPRPARTPPSADNIVARLLGIVVFLAGVALLGYVFTTADTLFRMPPPQVPAAAATQAASGNASAAPSAAILLGQSLTEYLKKLLTLLLMCVAGSLIASKGIQLYFSAGRAHGASQPPVAPTDPAP